jgi:predicted PurR-regulated permease PerM
MSDDSSPPVTPPSGFPPAMSADTVETVETAIRGIRSRGPELFFRFAFVSGFVVLVWPMLVPLVLGGLAAIVLQPVDMKLAARLGRLTKRPRASAALSKASSSIVTAAAVMGFLVPLGWVVWRSITALNEFVSSLLVGGVGATRERLVRVLAESFGTSRNEQAIATSVDEAIRNLGTALASFLTNLARGLPGGITQTFLFVLALYFGLRDGPQLVAWARRASPITSRRTDLLFDAVQRSVKGTMVGMVVVAGVQGGLAFVALLGTRVDHALLWAFVAAICSAMPIVGTTPVTAGAAVWLYLQGRPIAALVMVAAAIIIGVSDNVVRPWVQSQHDHVHPLVALVAIFGGLAIFGFSGLLFGPVLASMAVWAVETYRDESDDAPPVPWS